MTNPVGRLQRLKTNGARVLGASLLAACGAATPLGASDADLTRAHDLSSHGADVFNAECARCHGTRGEGLAGAPAILGPSALPTYPRDYSGTAMTTDFQQLQIQQQSRPAGAPRRDPFRTANDVFIYVSNHLPKSRAAAMKSDDYWGVVSYVLAAQGTAVPSGGLNAGNASTIALPER
jgi:mono/diheme cytochrome c family protein